jgi:hypothetical protein
MELQDEGIKRNHEAALELFRRLKLNSYSKKKAYTSMWGGGTKGREIVFLHGKTVGCL